MAKAAIIGLAGTAAVAAVGAGVWFATSGDGPAEAEVRAATNDAAAARVPGVELSEPDRFAEIERAVEEAVVVDAPQEESWEDRVARMRARFDADGDGELNDEERRLAREAMREERRQRLLERFDANGDGELDDAERQNARRTEFLESTRGRRLLARFDADGDGTLSDAEWDAVNADREQRRDEAMVELTAEFDTDGSGDLDDFEMDLARATFRERFQAMREEASIQFDADGDGELNRDERREAWQAFGQLQQQAAFVREYDFDGDGTVSALDAASYAEMFQNGDRAVTEPLRNKIGGQVMHRRAVPQSGDQTRAGGEVGAQPRHGGGVQGEAGGVLDRPAEMGGCEGKAGRAGQGGPFAWPKAACDHGACAEPERIARGQHGHPFAPQRGEDRDSVGKGHGPGDEICPRGDTCG